MSRLPQFLLDMLSACPRAGGGVHAWLFRCARHLHHHYGDDLADMAALLAGCAYGCGRAVPESEIYAAIRDSKACAWKPGQRAEVHGAAPTWPKRDPETVARVCTPDAPCSLEELIGCSMWHAEGNSTDAESVIDRLFPGNPLLCCGSSNWEFKTLTREEWRGRLSDLQFIVPSAMRAREGRKKNFEPGEDSMSARTNDNVGERSNLVVEFDRDESGTIIPIAEQIAALWHLDEYLPLVLALHSGGKSVHGWFACGKETEAALKDFMRYACTLGADPRGWVRSQFFRMPGGRRDNGKQQIVYYFSPEDIQ